MAAAVKGSKPKSVNDNTGGREFVLGSKPPDMYSPRIKPLNAQTNYGKPPGGSGSSTGGPARTPNLAGVNAGLTNRPVF